MKVLQFNCEYKTGSTGKITDSIAQYLKKEGNDVFTCYGLREQPDDGESKCICSSYEHNFNALLGRIIGIPYGGFYLSNKKIESIITSFKADIVHIHCINGYIVNIYQLLSYLAKKNVKTVVTLHAEFFFTGGCAHSYDCIQWHKGCKKCDNYKKALSSWFFDRSEVSWKKMRQAFSKFKNNNIDIIAVSPWLEKRAKMSEMFRDFNVLCIGNGVNTDIFRFRNVANKQYFSSCYSKRVLFVTAHFSTSQSDSKGGRFLIKLAERTPTYQYIVVARTSEVNYSELPTNIHFFGSTNNQIELAELYSFADVSITLGKRETFSMIVAESLCCGTPIVGFRAGGPESIGMPDYSKFVEYGDINSLLEAMNQMLKKSFNKLDLSLQAKSIYSDSIMTKEYLNAYISLLKR